jgi:hypothetical protein
MIFRASLDWLAQYDGPEILQNVMAVTDVVALFWQSPHS